MARGSKTPDDIEARFRTHFLASGNASAAARATKIPVGTGLDLAKRALEDPAFLKAREELRALNLPEAEALMMSAMRAAHARVLTADPTPQQLAKLAVKHGLKSFSYQNPKPQYLRGIVDGFGKLTAHRRFEAEKTGEIANGPAVVIVTTPEEPANDAAPTPEPETRDDVAS